MNTKNNRNEKIITSLLSVIALVAAVVGCSFNTSPTADTAAPANKATPANTAAPANTATAENPATVFYGTWEKKEPGQPFRYETFGQASKQGDNYVGKVTDQRNVVVANYTVFGDKTVEIAYLPAYYGGTTFTYGYIVSDGGNKLTLDSNPPIVYTKGTANTGIQKDATFFASGTWHSAKDKLRELEFTDAKLFDRGWSGNYGISYNGTTEEVGAFTIIETGKMTLMETSGGSKTFTYKIRGGNLFDFTRDSTGDTDSYTK